jgi:PAS domain-containing protein
MPDDIVQLMADAMNSLPDAVLLIASDLRRVLYVNEACGRVWAVTPQRLCAHPDAWLEALHHEDSAALRQALAGWTGGDKPALIHRTVRLDRPDGTCLEVRCRIIPVYREGTMACACVLCELAGPASPGSHWSARLFGSHKK